MVRTESLLARKPALSVGETLQNYYKYSVAKWQRYSPVASPFYNRGSQTTKSLGKNLLVTGQRGSPPGAAATRAQQFQILSTAKNIPRSALDNCSAAGSSDNRSTQNGTDTAMVERTGNMEISADIELLKYPPFVNSMDPNTAIPQIPFLVYKDDDLTDEAYGTWLAKQLEHPEQVKHLISKPVHLQPVAPSSLKPSEAEAKKVMWTNDMHHWIYRLLNYPADFDPLLPTMIDTMRMGVAHFGDEFNQIMVDAVYQTCMYDHSFCLVGSKLCNVISNSVKREDRQTGFRSFLLQKLQKDFEDRDLLAKSVNPNDRKRIQHVAYFLADLLNNLIIVTKDNNMSRITSFVTIIPKLLVSLMQVPSSSNIRTVCNVLRIGVGPIIELEFSKSSDILRVLVEALREHKGTNQHVNKVLQLRDSGWEDYLHTVYDVELPQRPYDIEGCEREPVYFNRAGVPYLAASTADPAAQELFY